MAARMDLWIVRHGPNDLGGSETYDRLRGLVPMGIRHVKAVARKMKEDGEVPRVILASPFARTLETADILGMEFGGVRVVPTSSLGPCHPLFPFMMELMADDVCNAMLVGHHSSFERLLNNNGDNEAPSILACAEARRYELSSDECGWKLRLRYRLMPSDVGMKDMIV